MEGNLQLPVFSANLLKHPKSKLIELLQGGRLTRIPGLSILIQIKVHSSPAEAMNYSCPSTFNYKLGGFNTYHIKAMSRENELILKLFNRKKMMTREIADYLAEQLFADLKEIDKINNEGEYLQKMRDSFSEFWEIDEASRFVNDMNFFTMKMTRGVAVCIDRITNIPKSGKLSFYVAF